MGSGTGMDQLKHKPAFTLVEAPADKQEKIEVACRRLCEIYGQDQQHWKQYENRVLNELHIRSALITAGLMGLFDE